MTKRHQGTATAHEGGTAIGGMVCVNVTRVARAVAANPRVATGRYLLNYGGREAGTLEAWRTADPRAEVHHRDAACLRASEPRMLWNEGAVVDMFAARDAAHFVGSTYSSFSNGVSMMRALRNRSSFVYSCPQHAPILERRFDKGEIFADLASGKVRLASEAFVADYCRFVATGRCPASRRTSSTEEARASVNTVSISPGTSSPMPPNACQSPDRGPTRWLMN